MISNNQQEKSEMLKRDLHGVSLLPFLQSALKDHRQEEFAADYLTKQLEKINYNTFNDEQKIQYIRKLIENKDIRTALKLAIEIKIIKRHNGLVYCGTKFEDKMFISFTDLNKQFVAFGLIETIFTFNFKEYPQTWIQIQLLVDAKTFNLLELPFNQQVLKNNEQESLFYSPQELILTDQFFFIQLGQVMERIYLETPLKYACMDKQIRAKLTYFFNRFKYNVESQQMVILNQEGFKECEQCKDLIDPSSDIIKLCGKCQKNFVHEKCRLEKQEFICSQYDY